MHCAHDVTIFPGLCGWRSSRGKRESGMDAHRVCCKEQRRGRTSIIARSQITARVEFFAIGRTSSHNALGILPQPDVTFLQHAHNLNSNIVAQAIFIVLWPRGNRSAARASQRSLGQVVQRFDVPLCGLARPGRDRRPAAVRCRRAGGQQLQFCLADGLSLSLRLVAP